MLNTKIPQPQTPKSNLFIKKQAISDEPRKPKRAWAAAKTFNCGRRIVTEESTETN